jgi:hypothetical protein
MQPESAAIPMRKLTARSRVTNGWPFPEGCDGRKTEARRFRDLCAALVSEYSEERALTGTDHALIRQCAGLMVRCEQMQAAVIRDERVDEDALIRLSSEARRILGVLRRRTAKREPSAPDLRTYLATAAEPAPRSPDGSS